MSEIIYIYNDKLELIAQPYATSYEDFKNNPALFYPDWQSSFYATQDKYNNPIISDGALREKTREELILIDNKLELLQDGEYIEQGKIIVVPCPEGLLKKKWDKTAHVWGEEATVEELSNSNDKKYDKTGGTISGNVVVTGNEVVNGSISCNSIILNGYTITIE